MASEIQFSKMIEAPVETVFFSFSTKTGFKEWFCKFVEVNRHKANYYSFYWDEDYFAQGTFLNVEKNKEISFTWQGNGDPNITNVKVTFDRLEKKQTQVNIAHRGFSEDKEWDSKRPLINDLWEKGLENLKTVLESGVDSRDFKKPMMGILDGGLVTPPLARSKNLPVAHGLLLADVIEGMGAAKAGLIKGDQITEINGIPFEDVQDFRDATGPLSVGDYVEVVYFRGNEKKTAKVELTAPPPLPIPATAQELAEEIDSINKKANAKLDEVLYQVTEAQADFRPAPKEWSIKEILAHMIATETDSCGYVATMVKGNESYASSAFSQARLKSMLLTYPLIKDLRKALEENQVLGTHMLAELPAEFMARKSTYVRLSTIMLYDTGTHYAEHIEQIQNNLLAAKDIN